MLSDRQSAILRKIAAGKTDKEIASELGIKETTVGFHLSLIFARLRVHTRAHAIARWRHR